jgi:nicotinate-nucleotide--dimethylbenzimidazole phosphoribosyltransferase
MSYFPTIAAFEAALASLPHANEAAREAAADRQSQLTKPLGSLGRLEDIALCFAGWQARERPRIDKARMAIFAGNHGVAVHGVSAFPVSVTAAMVQNFEQGGAAINALCDAAGLELKVAAIDLDRPTADFTEAPAMTCIECLDALNIGANMVGDDLDLIALGEMGIGNSTAGAALAARSFGGTAVDWVGPGTGVDDSGKQRKIAIIDKALATHGYAAQSAFETLRRVGGREIAAMAGAILAARMKSIPVLLDGFICCSAAAPLAADNPAMTDHCIAAHQSAEPHHGKMLEHLGLRPLLSLGMRLGEGSGAAVAANLLRSAIKAHDQMATFAEASVEAPQ